MGIVRRHQCQAPRPFLALKAISGPALAPTHMAPLGHGELELSVVLLVRLLSQVPE
jgi:hypothetical protein